MNCLTEETSQTTCSGQITVLLADDHTLVRQCVRALLQTDRHFTVVGEASNGSEAVKLAQALRPDVILMDIGMPVLNGLDATRQIVAGDPTAKVLVLSAHSEEVYIRRLSNAGVAGYVEKQSCCRVLTKAIRKVAEGNTFFSPSVSKRLREEESKSCDRNGDFKANAPHLTPRESAVLQLVAEGLANKQIAAELGIDIKTVEKHRQCLMNKLNIHKTAGLTRYAIDAGIIESGLKLASA